MFGFFRRWRIRQNQLAQLKREDTEQLLNRNPATAYYDAHRLGARARFSGDFRSFIHWAAVAAEIARVSDNPMDAEVVKAIVDEEKERASSRPR
jgi:hypothetical protein